VVDNKTHALSAGVVVRLRRHIARWRPDVVQSFHCDADVYSRLAAAGSGAAVISSERTDHQRVAPLQRIGYRLTCALCDGVVANTHAGAEFARRLHRLPAQRVDVLGNVIDVNAVAERLARSEQPARQLFPGPGLKRICMVGSIHPQNDYPLALRALRRLLDRDASWRLVCAGEEPATVRGCKTQVLAERDRLELSPYVQFAGHRRDVVELIGSSELMLVTASRGGFPVVALEAMACGIPVVSTDYGELGRILPDRRQLVASRDARAVAEAVLRCFEDAEALRKAQRRWLEAHGTVQAGARALLAVYAKYLESALSRAARAPG
jgi:glycosyltransferase involved in cell wall biosynthesis